MSRQWFQTVPYKKTLYPLIENLSYDGEEDIEDERAYLYENRAGDIDQHDDEDNPETGISFHPFSSFMPPYLD